MNKFLQWFFTIPDAPKTEVVAQVVARPAVLNPTTTDQVAHAEWRAAHIQRYLDDPSNADQPHREHLEAERDMHLAALRMRTS